MTVFTPRASPSRFLKILPSFFLISTGEELSRATKHANKIIISIFWLWRPQSLTHTVADAPSRFMTHFCCCLGSQPRQNNQTYYREDIFFCYFKFIKIGTWFWKYYFCLKLLTTQAVKKHTSNSIWWICLCFSKRTLLQKESLCDPIKEYSLKMSKLFLNSLMVHNFN